MIARMKPQLTTVRKAFLKLIMAVYGPWYLLRAPSGNWHICWYHNAHDEQAMESFLIDEVDDEYCFSTRRAALKEILKSLDSEIEAGGAGYREARLRAMDSLISVMDEQDAASAQNDFSGSCEETRLIETWFWSDRNEAKARDAYAAARAEQDRRELVFEHIVRTFGEQVIEAINAAIESAWLAEAPKSRRTATGLKAGETLLMPQLAITNGRTVFRIPGRAKHLSVRTPLSKRDTIKGYVNHWQHSTWQDVVVPAIAQIIARLELEAQAVPPRGSSRPEVP